MDTAKQYVEANVTKPVRANNRSNVPARGNALGERYTQFAGKGNYSLADEGSYFVAKNPTPGTGIIGVAAAQTASDLETLLYIRNGASASDGTRIYLDYLRLVPTAAGTNGTTCQFYSWIDNADRFTSATATLTPVNVNMDSGVASSAVIKFGAVVTTAATSNKRTVGAGALRLAVIKVIGDIYQFDFGGFKQDVAPLVTSGTNQAFVPWRHAPVVLGPGHIFGLEVYAAAQTVAAAFEVELGYWER